MFWNKFFLEIQLFLLLNITFCAIQSQGIHLLEKRQIGVLARAGELPQGKRSKEIWSPDDILHVSSKEKDDAFRAYTEGFQNALNMEMRELKALNNKINEESDESALKKRSVIEFPSYRKVQENEPSGATDYANFLHYFSQNKLPQRFEPLNPEDYFNSLDCMPERFKSLFSDSSIICNRRNKSKDDVVFFNKRFLGRIPQLGRTHQKVQSSSPRRRPHLWI